MEFTETDSELRTYRITGEATPENWEAVGRVLGGLGLNMEVVLDDPNTEHVMKDDHLAASVLDLSRFVTEKGANSRTATRAWNCLASVHHKALYPDLYKDFFLEDMLNLRIPVRMFVHNPRDGKFGRAASGLRIEELERLIEPLVKRGSSLTRAEASNFAGINSGLAVFEFCRDFCAWMRQQALDQEADLTDPDTEIND